MQRTWIAGLIAIATAGWLACDNQSGKQPTPGWGPQKHPGEQLVAEAKPAGRGGDTAQAAATAMLAAIVAEDLDAARRMVPDADACKQMTALPVCTEIQGNLEKSWDRVKTIAPGYKGAAIARSPDPSPVPGGEVWVATATGVEPLKFAAFQIGDRFYAPIFAGGGAKPPSTGNEMPEAKVSMTKEQARKIVDETVALMDKPEPPCEQIVDTLTTALPIAFPGDKLTKDAEPGVGAMGKCASRTQRWRAVVLAGTALLGVTDDVAVPAHIVRALAEMGEYDKALKTADELAKKYPASSSMLSAAKTFVYCRSEAWAKCIEVGEASMAELAKSGVKPDDKAMLINRVMLALAWIVTGKPQQGLDELDAIEKIQGPAPESVQRLADQGRLALERGYFFEAVPLPQLPTGVYHLMGRENTGALVTIKIFEHAGVTRQFRIESEIPGVTERSANTIELKPKASTIRWANPPLKMNFDPKLVRSPRPTQLALKIVELSKDGDKTVLDETIPIELLPRDYLPLKRKVGADSFVPTYGYMGAWITPNEPAIEEFLTKAKERAPGRAFVGEQDATAPQIKALFDELKARGVSYVMDPNVTSSQSFVQRTRLPVDVLGSTNAQCLEGTLLFATLMEGIGIRPIIILVPGHAFLGWHTVAKDGTKGEPLFVETTMVGNASFEQAVKVATARVGQEIKAGNFKTGASTVIDVAAIRQGGFTAQTL